MEQKTTNAKKRIDYTAYNDLIKSLKEQDPTSFDDFLEKLNFPGPREKDKKKLVENFLEKSIKKFPEFAKKTDDFIANSKNINEKHFENLLLKTFENLAQIHRVKKNQFKKGDIVAFEIDNQIIKGKVLEISKNDLKVNSFSHGEININIEKNKPKIMYPGQKYDIREVIPLFKEKGLDIKQIKNSELIFLLSGKMTKVHEIFNEENQKELVKFQIIKNNKGLQLSEIKKIPENKIYNRIITDDEINKLRAGEILRPEIELKNGLKFKILLKWDKDLNGIIKSNPNKFKKQKLNFKGYNLNEKELEKLNAGEPVKISLKNEKNNTLSNYELSYDLDLDELKSNFLGTEPIKKEQTKKTIVNKKKTTKTNKKTTPTKRKGPKI